MREKLFAELEPGEQRGFQVALVDWPSASVRTLAVVTAVFEEPSSQRRLAAIYLPAGPDPTSGLLRIVAQDELTLTGWTLDNITTFHLTYGTVVPETST
jgi:uncharacterized membrane protein